MMDFYLTIGKYKICIAKFNIKLFSHKTSVLFKAVDLFWFSISVVEIRLSRNWIISLSQIYVWNFWALSTDSLFKKSI